MKVKDRPITTVQLASSSYTTIYTVPEGADARIRITVCNDTSSNVSYSLWKVPSGGSPGDDNLIVNQEQLGDKESIPVRQLSGLVFGPGESLQGQASAADQVTVTGGVILKTRAQA